MTQQKYLVRQYRPNYCTGFEDAVYKDVPYDRITEVPFCANFKHSGFDHFIVEPYSGDELMVSAKYTNGESWVVAFALPDNSNDRLSDGELLRENWRYRRAFPCS